MQRDYLDGDNLLTTATFYTPVQNRIRQVETRMRDVTNGHHPDLGAALEHLLASGGKRVRPAVTLLTGAMLRADDEKIISLAASIELLHTATLVHDDLIDGALLRRGIPTVNAQWSPGATVLTGDFIFACAATLAAQTDSVELIHLFAETLATIVNGEITQMFPQQDYVDFDEYLKRIYAKTGSLFVLATTAPAILSPIRESVIDAARRFGNGIGMESVTFTGKRIPEYGLTPDLTKVKYGKPVQLFNGIDLSGWKLLEDGAASAWKVVDGVMVNDPVQKGGEEHIRYGNLRTVGNFEDFNLKLEVNVPEGSNSGVYLRGIYEVQVMDSYGKPLDANSMGALFSRIAPAVSAEKPAGEWQELDITLYKRHLTVVLNGKKISLDLEETLIALSISALSNPAAQMALANIDKLGSCEVHLTHIPTPGDAEALRQLQVRVTSDPEFSSKALYVS